MTTQKNLMMFNFTIFPSNLKKSKNKNLCVLNHFNRYKFRSKPGAISRCCQANISVNAITKRFNKNLSIISKISLIKIRSKLFTFTVLFYTAKYMECLLGSDFNEIDPGCADEHRYPHFQKPSLFKMMSLRLY